MKNSKPRTGALSVELALCAPILFLLLFACYEVAQFNFTLHAAESAAYEAARVGITPGASNDEIRDAASGILHSVGIRDFGVSISPQVITRETTNVKVDIDIDFSRNRTTPKLFLSNSRVRGSCQLSREVF